MNRRYGKPLPASTGSTEVWFVLVAVAVAMSALIWSLVFPT